MPVYLLGNEPVFPPPERADPSGLLAVGGSLSPEWLLSAYTRGIFPWFNKDEEMLWWSPNPRLVLFPNELKISKSMRQVLRGGKYTVRMNSCFDEVIKKCALVPRPGQTGTWLTSEMQTAYIRMHQLGWAHSFETFREGKLTGGLYGLSIGHVFFGESMFSLAPDASKVALVSLCRWSCDNNIAFIDCQATTAHLMRMGARQTGRAEFLEMLASALHTGKTSGRANPTIR